MNTSIGLENCLTFINCQVKPPRFGWVAHRNGKHTRAITISRQTGSGGHTVAEHLARILRAVAPTDSCLWTVFDRNLVEKVLEDHHLPKRLARFMPEDRISEVADTLDELFGLHPPSWMLVRKAAETILHLAELGNVILIGRGANIITARLDGMFHVRLVGSVEKRVQRIQELNSLGPRAALALVTREDRGRRRYLRKYFNKDIDDPLLYHLVINTDLVGCEEAAGLIAHSLTSQPELTRP
jgi:cytidylate kinase